MTLTAFELAEHRAAHDWCVSCDPHRPHGACGSCGGWVEAVGPDEVSVCCGTRVALSEHAVLAREEASERAFDQIMHDNVWTPWEAS